MRISDWSSDVCSSDLKHLHGSAGARPGIADIDPLALEVVEALRPDLSPCDQRDRLRMDGEDRAQLLERLGVGELTFRLVRIVLHVGLDHAQIELAGGDGVGVAHRAAQDCESDRKGKRWAM